MSRRCSWHHPGAQKGEFKMAIEALMQCADQDGQPQHLWNVGVSWPRHMPRITSIQGRC